MRRSGGADNFEIVSKASEGIIINSDNLSKIKPKVSGAAATVVNVPGLAELNRAVYYINSAKTIYILGFGYDEKNIEKIGLNNVVADSFTKIKGTIRQDIAKPHQERIIDAITGIELINSDINTFLKDEWA